MTESLEINASFMHKTSQDSNPFLCVKGSEALKSMVECFLQKTLQESDMNKLSHNTTDCKSSGKRDIEEHIRF